MKNKVSFSNWITEYGEKMNTCHSAGSGQFCAGGGRGKLSASQRRQAKAELDYLTSPQRSYRLNGYQQQRVRELKEQLGQ
jgi:hypothetical protein